jgi:hypothetical protein
MLASIVFLSLSLPSVAEPETMTLSLKAGDKITYTLEIKSSMMNLNATGKIPITVTKKEGTKLTLSWPQVEFTNVEGNFRPIEAGTAVISEKGEVLQPDAKGQVLLFLTSWSLPAKPISVGEGYKAVALVGASKIDLTGKFEKVTHDGAVAVLASDGKMGAQGGDISLRTESSFDIKRGIFRSGSLSMSTPQAKVMSTFSFKLVE